MERRHFFRIKESVGLSYCPLSEGEAVALAEVLRQGGGGIDVAANFDNRIHTLLESLRVQSAVAAELLELMNSKLNLVIRQLSLDAEAVAQLAFDMRRVSISACGLGTVVERMFEPGTPLRVDLLLDPGDLHLTVLARVVACEPLDRRHGDFVEDAGGGGQRCFLRLDFVEINPHDQELLIQHVVRRQVSQLKSRGEAPPSPP